VRRRALRGQVIELSADGGTTWAVNFDAVYTRAGNPLPAPAR